MEPFGFAYPAELLSQEGTVLVRFPDFPEALTEGEDVQDAVQQAADCLEEAIVGRIRRGDEIPRPSVARKRQHVIPVPAPTAGKAALYLALREAKITPSQLAARLGCSAREVRRLLDPRQPSELSRVQDALGVLGKHLVVEMRAA